MNLQAPISDIMQSEVIFVAPETSLLKVDRLLTDHGFHHLPVVDGGELVGIVSKNDLKYFKQYKDETYSQVLENKRLSEATASKIMTTGLAKVEPTDTIAVVLEVFKVNLFHAVLVVEDNKLKGIVTTFDIVNELSKAPAFA